MSEHFIINPTDAHNYKITGMLKTIKVLIIAPTCFGSRRNHHRGWFLRDPKHVGAIIGILIVFNIPVIL